MTAFGACIIVIIFLLIAYFNRAMREGWYFLFYKTGLQKKIISEVEKSRVKDYLKKFNYYTSLSDQGKEKFIERLFIFKFNTEFKGRNGLIVTEEMRVLISASAIQLTFGLEHFQLETLQTIFIYPDIFKLAKNSPEYKGATYQYYMHLSWKAFQEGYGKPDDNLNLGLHEMTHALKLSLYLGDSFDELFASRMEFWEQLMTENFKKITQMSSFLRSYSKANTEEFFAVCVEAFFESPQQFKRELAQIFQSLSFLLNQNPLNKQVIIK